MKKLFNISDEEKQRILEMHSPKKTISEQTLGAGTASEIKRGALINLYDTSLNLDNRYIVLDINQDMAGVITLKVKTSGGGITKKMTLTFRCADEMLTSSEKDKDNKVILFKSETVQPALRNKFCQKNKEGKWVPKASFASVGTPESPMV